LTHPIEEKEKEEKERVSKSDENCNIP